MTESKTTTCPDEDEIKLGFLGSHQEQCDALEKLWERYRVRLMAFAERRAPGLPSDLAANAVLDTFTDTFEAVQTGEFDYDRPIASFLFSVARRRVIDELRKYRCRPAGNADFYGCVGDLLKGTEVGKEWQTLVDCGKAPEISAKFRALALTLPLVQRQVAQVMADYLPDGLSREEICEEIHRRTGKRPTGVQVKSALREIRTKFRELMKRK